MISYCHPISVTVIWGLRDLFIYLFDMNDYFILNGGDFGIGGDYDGLSGFNGLIW